MNEIELTRNMIKDEKNERDLHIKEVDAKVVSLKQEFDKMQEKLLKEKTVHVVKAKQGLVEPFLKD